MTRQFRLPIFCSVVAAVSGLLPLAAQAAGGDGGTPQSRPASQPSASAADPQERVIRFLEERLKRDPDDVTARNRLSGCYLSRFRSTGDDHDLILASQAADESLRALPAIRNASGLAAKARAAFALHGFAAARDIGLQLIESEPGKRFPLEILGDALLELGDYDAAADAYAKMQTFNDGDSDVSTETRLARLALIRGDIGGARTHFENAIELATLVRESSPEVLCWCEVQLGQLNFSAGDWAGAEKHYRAALEVRPTDWPAIDHLAELRAAQKRYDEAVALYEPLIARVPRPELCQSLGDVFAAMGKDQEAKHWHQVALEKYVAACASGSSHYYHHLAGFYADTQPDPTEAVKWAKKDLEVRHSIYAYDGLAWALYQSGDFKGAATTMDKALILPTKDAHLLYHASLIYYHAGDQAKGRAMLMRAGEANPKFNEFHVHR